MRAGTFVRAVILSLLILAARPLAGQSAATLSGRITDASGAPLSGVQIVVADQTTGTQTGNLSQDDGRYVVGNLRGGGPYRVEARMIGYGVQIVTDLALRPGQARALDLVLSQEVIALDALEVFATRAIERQTPVAFSDVPKVQIQQQLGSRDLPMVLSITPSVYATQQGGGAGDARINVRGFSQRNTAVMINGVPVNDMENGWVYWSNWDGLGDAATSIQLQRGLSAVNLATPSIGGTMNIITDPTQQEPGFKFKQEFGSGSFLKESFGASTGMIGRFALSGMAVRKTGDGIFEYGGGRATYTDAWAYYLATSFQVNPKNRVEVFAVGAPQRHGQNLYKLNIGTLDADFARSLDGYDPAALARFPEAGRTWSPNVNKVDPSYAGMQYASTGPGNGTFRRFGSDYINERENYFHKPQVNLNWYSYLGNGLTWSTVGYYSGGAGGGSGTLGSSSAAVFDVTYTQRVPNWDATIAKNRARADGSAGFILRNSVNNQTTVGAISKLRKEFSSWTSEIGLDWRTAQIEHYREVRDLLGGQYFVNASSQFWTGTETQRKLGDKIDYHNENAIDWIGVYAQAERSTTAGSLYGMAGWTMNSYTLTDFFKRAAPGSSDFRVLESGNLTGWQVKGGAVRNLTDAWSVFGNAGYVRKVPIYDEVIDDVRGLVNQDPTNEQFISFEGGLEYRARNRGLSFDLNAYHTDWKDRTYNLFVRNIDGQGNDGRVSLAGVNARHMGIEAQAGYQPAGLIRFDVAGSVGKWKYRNDVKGTYVSDDRAATQDFAFYIADLMVADAPQTQVAYGVSLFPVRGLFLKVQGKTFDRHFSEFSPFNRTSPTDRAQPWQAPGYTVFDLHGSYRLGDVLPVWRGGDLRVFANLFNALDEVYVQDAVDNSSFNGFAPLQHKADDAEVFLGLPRSFNVGFEIGF